MEIINNQELIREKTVFKIDLIVWKYATHLNNLNSANCLK